MNTNKLERYLNQEISELTGDLLGIGDYNQNIELINRTEGMLTGYRDILSKMKEVKIERFLNNKIEQIRKEYQAIGDYNQNIELIKKTEGLLTAYKDILILIKN